MLAPCALSLHLKDYVIRPDLEGIGLVITGVPLGEGMQNSERILEIVRASEKDPNVILEQWMRHRESEVETLQMELEWMRKSVGAGRQLIRPLGGGS